MCSRISSLFSSTVDSSRPTSDPTSEGIGAIRLLRSGTFFRSVSHSLAKGRMRNETGDLLQGTLAILILKALLGGSAHGYGIARWVETTTEDVLRIEEGSL